jgi:hypothetical protein
MVRLQGMYDRLAEMLKECQTPPEAVSRLEEEGKAREQEIAELELRLEELNDEVKKVRTRQEEAKLELEHFQKQKAMVSNEREFTAVINEIEFASKAKKDAEARREELETEIGELTSRIEELRKVHPEEEAERQRVVAEWEHRKSELTQSVHHQADRAKELEQQLAPPHRARFRRLLERKHGSPVSAVVEGSCSFCHFSLRPHLHQRVRRADEIITCEHCHRILYLDDMPELGNDGAD